MIYICIDNAETSITAAITLAGMPSFKGIPMVVRSTYDDGLTRIFTSLAQNNAELSHIRTFPLVSNDCAKPLDHWGNERDSCTLLFTIITGHSALHKIQLLPMILR